MPGPLLVQRQGRALRGLPGRRRHQDRDALPARRLCAVRRLQGPALQPRDAGGAVPRQVDRRRARHDGRRGRRVLPRRAGDPRQAGDPAAGRARLHPYRPAGDDPVGRRGAARQARQGTVAPRHRPHPLHPRRADHRPAFRGRAASCSKCCTRWSRPATRCWSSSTISKSSRPPTGSSISAPRAATAAATSSPPAPPEEIAKVAESYTGQYLARHAAAQRGGEKAGLEQRRKVHSTSVTAVTGVALPPRASIRRRAVDLWRRTFRR